MRPEIIGNLQDPKREGTALVGDASDEELLRAIERAEAKAELPSEATMKALAARLGPIVATRSSSTPMRRWFVVAAMVGVVSAGTVFVRSRLEAPSNRGPVAEVSNPVLPIPQATTSAVPLPSGPAGEVTAPSRKALTVEPLPATSATARARKSTAESACAGDIELVDRADAALRAGDAQQALGLTRQHAERCPSGVYAQERERVAIEALARLGRTSEVRARAAVFEKRFPSSPHLRRIRGLAEGEAR